MGNLAAFPLVPPTATRPGMWAPPGLDVAVLVIFFFPAVVSAAFAVDATATALFGVGVDVVACVCLCCRLVLGDAGGGRAAAAVESFLFASAIVSGGRDGDDDGDDAEAADVAVLVIFFFFAVISAVFAVDATATALFDVGVDFVACVCLCCRLVLGDAGGGRAAAAVESFLFASAIVSGGRDGDDDGDDADASDVARRAVDGHGNVQE